MTTHLKYTENEERESEVELSPVLPAPAGNVSVGGVPAAATCDDPLPVVSAPVLISWDPVTTSHPTLGEDGPIEVDEYQFFVERDDVNFGVELPPTVTAFTVPAEVLALGDEFKFEILVRADNGNNTAVESCFLVE